MKLTMEFSPGVLDVMHELASRQCEGAIRNTFPPQACTARNPCLVCRAGKENERLKALPRHPASRR